MPSQKTLQSRAQAGAEAGTGRLARPRHGIEGQRSSLYIGVYRTDGIEVGPAWSSRTYYSYVGELRLFGQQLFGDELLKLEGTARIPVEWDMAMRAHLRDGQRVYIESKEGYIARLGFIGISLSRSGENLVATTSMYYPRDFLSVDHAEKARGVGRLTEHMIAKLLEEEGVTHMGSSGTDLAPRRKQLSEMGLPSATAVPIAEWIQGTERGYRMSLERQMRESH